MNSDRIETKKKKNRNNGKYWNFVLKVVKDNVLISVLTGL